MDLHLNELVFEEGFRNVALKELSFRDIDQEFVIVHSETSYGSAARNDLYYCYIRPGEGIFFRLIGISDETEGVLKVDEDRTEIEDTPYEDLAGTTVSKIVENGDLISNRLITDIPDEYYEGEDLKDLLETRKLTWLDEVRKAGYPDRIVVSFCDKPLELVLIKCQGEVVLTEDSDGTQYLYDRNGEMMKYCES